MRRQSTVRTFLAAWMACFNIHGVEAQWAQNLLKFFVGSPQKTIAELAIQVTNFNPNSKNPTFAVDEDQAIAGGFQVNNTRDYPFSVRLGDVGCTGTHIFPGIVLTSGRCIIQGLPPYVTIGATNAFDGKDVLVETGYYYPDFINLYPYRNDIALVKLATSSDTDLNKFQTISFTDNSAYPPVDSSLTMIGYGRSVTSDNADEDLFKLQGFVVLADDVCSSDWKDKQTRGAIDSDLTYCAQSSGNSGGCSGDLGAPLLDSSNVQVGILSFVDTCGGDFPDAFTRVSHFASWIYDMICAIENNRPSFCQKQKQPCLRAHNSTSADGDSDHDSILTLISQQFGF